MDETTRQAIGLAANALLTVTPVALAMIGLRFLWRYAKGLALDGIPTHDAAHTATLVRLDQDLRIIAGITEPDDPEMHPWPDESGDSWPLYTPRSEHLD